LIDAALPPLRRYVTPMIASSAPRAQCSARRAIARKGHARGRQQMMRDDTRALCAAITMFSHRAPITP